MAKVEKRTASVGPVVPYVEFYKSLYDQVLAGRFTANEYKVVLAVIRWTIGHHHQDDGARISARWIAKTANIHAPNVTAVLEGLIAEGVIRQVVPVRERKAPTLAIEQDSHMWGRHARMHRPPRRKAGGNAAKLNGYQEGDANCKRRRWQPASADASSNCKRGRYQHKEEREERSLKDGGSSAEAPPPSVSEEPYFEIEGFGKVYEHDTWALGQPDTRPLYIQTFGARRRKAS